MQWFILIKYMTTGVEKYGKKFIRKFDRRFMLFIVIFTLICSAISQESDMKESYSKAKLHFLWDQVCDHCQFIACFGY